MASDAIQVIMVHISISISFAGLALAFIMLCIEFTIAAQRNGIGFFVVCLLWYRLSALRISYLIRFGSLASRVLLIPTALSR